MPVSRLRAPTLSDDAFGVVAALLAVALFASMDAIGKGLTQRYDPFMVAWARYFSQAVLVVLILSPRLRTVARTRRPGLQFLRSLFLLGATLTFFTAFAHIPLAEATAIFEVAPLIVTGLAAFALKEHVGPGRWMGVMVGFVGALIIIRPGFAVFQPMALMPLLAAFCFACHAIVTRFLGHGESPWTSFLYTSVIGGAGASLLAPFVWTTPSLEDAVLMTSMGAIGGAGQFLLIAAFRRASAAAVAPTIYFGLVMATILGFVFFGETPDAWTVAGALVVVSSGLYVWRRELVEKSAQADETAS